MSSIPSREEALFADALAQPEADRGAFLVKACGPDVALLARIAGLIAAHEGTQSLLASAPVHQGAIAAEEKSGDVIGRYNLLQKIGEGAALSVVAEIGDRIGQYRLLQKIGEEDAAASGRPSRTVSLRRP